jgi:hypothetical protein
MAEQIEVTPEMARQIAAYMAKQSLKPRQMRTVPVGRRATPIIVSTDGRQYVQPKRGGAYVRVAVDGETGDVARIIPWSKAKRKAMKRQRQRELANGNGTV